MGIAYRCDAALGCTFIVWDGDVTAEEWREHFDRLTTDPAFPPGPLMLGDISTARRAASITPDVVAEIGAAWHRRAARLPPLKLAIVPNGAWDEARQLERAVEGSGLTAILFNDIATACVWLGLNRERAAEVNAEIRAGLPQDAS